MLVKNNVFNHALNNNFMILYQTININVLIIALQINNINKKLNLMVNSLINCNVVVNNKVNYLFMKKIIHKEKVV